jgi:hypothetical protein
VDDDISNQILVSESEPFHEVHTCGHKLDSVKFNIAFSAKRQLWIGGF